MTQLGSSVTNIGFNKNKTYSLDTIMQRTKMYWNDTKHPELVFSVNIARKVLQKRVF